MAVFADKKVFVFGELGLVLFICPGMGVGGQFPFLINFLMALATCLGI